MDEKVIRLEDKDSTLGARLERILRMVPDRDREDQSLRQLLAFRLRIDGEDRIREYLIKKIRAAIECRYTGSFYDFIKDDLKERECLPKDDRS
jgi:hypothetical protein